MNCSVSILLSIVASGDADAQRRGREERRGEEGVREREKEREREREREFSSALIRIFIPY